MKDEDVRVGMRVVPHDKTAGGTGLEECLVWRLAKEIGHPYLFVDAHIGKYWRLCHTENGEDAAYFYASDFEPYEDLDRRIAKAERELARLIAERDAEKLLPVGAEVWVRGKIVAAEKDRTTMPYYIEFDNRWHLWLKDANIKEVE